MPGLDSPWSVVLGLVAYGCRERRPAWREAAAGYQFAFPRDHASHPEFKLEWWYYTGNLETSAGRRFGYQVTFFRVGVDSGAE